MNIDKENNLLRISNHLILNSSNVISPGLFNGKMGIIIFFFHYGIYSKKRIYGEFAELLLEELFSEIDVSISYTLEDGLAGIGWGIEYLVQTGFIEGNPTEILYNLDQEIMKTNVGRLSDFSFKRGVGGLVFYIFARLNSPVRDIDNNSFDNIYIEELIKVINAYDLVNDPDNLAGLFVSFRNSIQNTMVPNEKIKIPKFLYNSMADLSNLSSRTPLGIYNGWAGIGLKYILE